MTTPTIKAVTEMYEVLQKLRAELHSLRGVAKDSLAKAGMWRAAAYANAEAAHALMHVNRGDTFESCLLQPCALARDLLGSTDEQCQGGGQADWVPVCLFCNTAHTAASWARLRLVGHQEDGAGWRLELRDCCGSTLGLPVPVVSP
jgi:hypothetical protein